MYNSYVARMCSIELVNFGIFGRPDYFLGLPMHKHVITLRACATGKVIGRIPLSLLSVCQHKNGSSPDPGCSISCNCGKH